MQRVVCVIIRNIMKKQSTQDDPGDRNRDLEPEKEEKGEGISQPNTKKRRGRGLLIALGVIAALIVILLALYQIPAIHDRAYFYVTTLRSKVFTSCALLQNQNLRSQAKRPWTLRSWRP